jgi:hypothetical protein
MRPPRLFAAASVLAFAFVGSRADGAGPAAVSCLSANEASIALRSKHRLLDAREKLQVCAAQTCPTDVRAECARRLKLVEAAIPTVIFEARDRADAPLTGVNVVVDGRTLVDHLDGTAVALDPGEHELVFTAKDAPPTVLKLTLKEREKDRREHVVLAVPAPALAAPAEPPPEPAAPETKPALPQQEAASQATRQKTVAAVVGGAGLVGLGLGIFFGVRASSSWSAAQDACDASNCPDRARALSEHDKATSAATASTVAFIIGGAALAGGIVLFATAPSGTQAAVRVTPTASGGALSVTGRF